MSTIAAIETPEAEIRELVNSWVQAATDKDLDRVMRHYAQDIIAYDAICELQFKGVDAYRKHWDNCLSMCPGPMIFDVNDLSVTAGDDIAFCSYLNRCGGVDEKGEEKTSWMRATVCFRRLNGEWKIVHEHYSAPFDVESGKALFELEP